MSRHGAQGIHDGASKATLENEFETKNEDEVMMKILEKGEIQDSEVSRLLFSLSLSLSLHLRSRFRRFSSTLLPVKLSRLTPPRL